MIFFPERSESACGRKTDRRSRKETLLPGKITRRKFLTDSTVLAAAFSPRLPHYQALADALGDTKSKRAVPGTVALPHISLRGYGTISATFRHLHGAGGPASLLVIQCDTPAKALLVQSKYLSDLALMPGTEPVTLDGPGGKIVAHRAGAEGLIAACAVDRVVSIFSAKQKHDILALIAAHLPKATLAGAFLPRVQIPMYLDRWDKYGLLAYYGAFTTPPGTQNDDYDFMQDFDFAAEHGPLGLVVWDNETMNDTAEGMANTPLWDWVAAECRVRHLPLHINTQSGAALWLTNRFREETMQKAPQYCGAYYNLLEPNIGEQGYVSWNAGVAQDVELGVLQQTVRRFASDPNVVGWLEPHSETDSPPQSLLVEYGPVADRSYRRFLRGRYASPAALSKAWHGDAGALPTWEEVRVPELASFLGWGPDALDMTGAWRVRSLAAPDGHAYSNDEAHRVGQGPTPTEPILPAWYQPEFDDTAWGRLSLPGNDRQMYLPHSPSILRRTFEAPADWLAAHPRVWLYLWDLTELRDDTYPIYINGRKAPEMPLTDRIHWGAIEISGLLHAGSNFIALRLPKGYIAYRFYLSPHPPNQYPNLGPMGNARWADFSDWVLWWRGQAIRRGAEMIRQIDPNRQINFMAPNLYCGVIKRVCEEYGGQFHDTGSMAGFWNEINPMLMRGSGLPATAEPGNGAPAVDGRGGFHAFWGRWLTEGIQGVHYFQHLGDITWNADIRKDFETHRRMYQMVGKYHVPFAEVAILYSFGSAHATGWPWGYDPNTNLTGGYWAWNTGFTLLNYCPRDGVTEEDFEVGNVDRYRVIIDSNTSILSPELLSRIEQWVRKGGTFVTFVQTGRHTPTAPNTWPISRLTGYAVTRIDRYGAGNQPQEGQALHPAPGQKLLEGEPWTSGVRASGLSLKKTAPDCQDLLLWEDGSVAAGVRRLGAGRIFHLGAHFETLGDRRDSPHTTALLTQILAPMQVERVPGQAHGVMMRHYISNNGLHDVWVLFNDRETPVTTDLIFLLKTKPRHCLAVKTGQETPLSTEGDRHGVRGIVLEPYETHMFLTPRPGMELAPLEWLSVQRSWWRTSRTPSSTPLPTPASDQHHTIDLNNGWAFKPVDGMEAKQIAALLAAHVDDAHWERMRLGIWSLPAHQNVKHAVLRKRFTVPTHWTAGQKEIWVRSWSASTFRDRGAIYLDGAQIQDFNADGMSGYVATERLKAGSEHVLALEIQGRHSLCGATGSAWISHLPDPAFQQDLGGEWSATRDGLQETAPVNLPGPFQGMFVTRTFRLSPEHAGRNILCYIDAEGPVVGVLINGVMISRHHHMLGHDFALDLTPLIRPGEENSLELISRSPDSVCTVHTIELRFYDPAVYP